MPKLSLYKTGYDNEQDYKQYPWRFWTEQQKSLVIGQAYTRLALSSQEVKPYLATSRMHSITQWLVPVATAVVYQGFLRNTLFKPLYRRSPLTGHMGGAAFLGLTTLLWLNFSPFYISKQKAQDDICLKLYGKIGSAIVGLNGMVPRFRTSVEIDRRTRKLYDQRNGSWAGTCDPQQDQAPPILPKRPQATFNKSIWK